MESPTTYDVSGPWELSVSGVQSAHDPGVGVLGQSAAAAAVVAVSGVPLVTVEAVVAVASHAVGLEVRLLPGGGDVTGRSGVVVDDVGRLHGRGAGVQQRPTRLLGLLQQAAGQELIAGCGFVQMEWVILEYG